MDFHWEIKREPWVGDSLGVEIVLNKLSDDTLVELYSAETWEVDC